MPAFFRAHSVSLRNIKKSLKMPGLCRTRGEKHQQRPLQCVVGVTDTATGHHRSGKNKREFVKKINETGDTVQDQTVRPVLDQTPIQCSRAPELEDQVRELKRLLRKANRECKQRRKYNNILQSENEQMKMIFQQKEMFLKKSLADAELRHQKAVESVSKLEEEKSELTKSVKKLRSVVQELGEELCDAHLESDELQIEFEQNQEAHSALLLEFEEMKKELKKSLSDAELRHQKAVESVSQLEEEKSELTKSVKKLRSVVQELGEELCDAHLESDELQIEHEQLQETHSALLVENEELKKELKVSLADAELKHQKALENISQLEKEKSDLVKQVTTLRSTVQELEEELCHAPFKSDELQIEFEEVSQAEAELKYQEAMKSISQLVDENSELKNLVKKLRYTVQELGEELYYTHLDSDEFEEQQ